MLGNRSILKLTEPFCWKNLFFFFQIWAKCPKWPQNRLFWSCWKILSLVFSENNVKLNLILLLIFCHQSYNWQNSCFWVMGQIAVDRWACRILQNVISQERSEWWSFFSRWINIVIFYKLILSFWVCIARYVQSTQNKLAYFCNILRKISGMKLIFYLQINMKVFYKLIVWLWVRIPSHSQSAQNNKFAMSLQFLKKKRKNEVDFLSTDKH